MAGDSEKDRFLKEFGRDYGYPNAPKNIDEIRATEFKRLKGLDFPLFQLFGFHMQNDRVQWF